jgi:hypothetical protein
MMGRGAMWLLVAVVLSSGAYAAVPSSTAPRDTDTALSAAAEESAAQLTIMAEWLRVRYALGDFGPADRAREMREAVERMRQGTLPPSDVLRGERQRAAERLITQTNARLTSASWPTDRPSEAYHTLSSLRLEYAREQWPRIQAAGGELAGFLRPIVEVLWWTYGRTDGRRAFDEIDEEIDWAARAAFSNLPLLPPSRAARVGASPAVPTAGGTGARDAGDQGPLPVVGSLTGRWTGPWSNTRGESGTSVFVLTEGPGGVVTGTDDGARIFNGRRSGNIASWQAEFGGCRDYRVTFKLSQDGNTLSGPYEVIDRCRQPPRYAGNYGGHQREGRPAPPVARNPAFEYDIDRPGGDYRNFELTVANPELCSAACAQEGPCRAWTFVKPGVQGALARCWLKSQVPSPVRNATFAISGVKP